MGQADFFVEPHQLSDSRAGPLLDTFEIHHYAADIELGELPHRFVQLPCVVSSRQLPLEAEDES